MLAKKGHNPYVIAGVYRCTVELNITDGCTYQRPNCNGSSVLHQRTGTPGGYFKGLGLGGRYSTGKDTCPCTLSGHVEKYALRRPPSLANKPVPVLSAWYNEFDVCAIYVICVICVIRVVFDVLI